MENQWTTIPAENALQEMSSTSEWELREIAERLEISLQDPTTINKEHADVPVYAGRAMSAGERDMLLRILQEGDAAADRSKVDFKLCATAIRLGCSAEDAWELAAPQQIRRPGTRLL